MKMPLIAAIAAVATNMLFLPCESAFAATFDLTYEAPGVQQSTTPFSISGVEGFDTLPVGMDSFTTDFGTQGKITGQFDNFPVVTANLWGGAGGTGNYVQLFSSDVSTLTLTEQPGSTGVNYLGFWLSALSGGNTVSFYNGSTLLQTYDASTVFNGIPAATLHDYLGNPNADLLGQDGGEYFAFVNFYLTGGGTFNKVVFTQTAGGGFEADNFTVGAYVPEPGVWAMMLLGLGGLGMALRAQRRATARGLNTQPAAV